MGVCFKGSGDIANILIEHGANLNIQHRNGGTALMFATMFDRNDLVKLMLQHGADRTIMDSKGLMAIDHAGLQGNKEAVDLLSKFD